jgi:hypothetical protein
MVILDKLMVVTLVNTFAALYGNRNFIIVFTKARHRSLFKAELINFTSFYLPFLSSFCTMSFCTNNLHSGLFPSDLSTTLLLFPRWIFSLRFRHYEVNFSYETPNGTRFLYTNLYPLLGYTFIYGTFTAESSEAETVYFSADIQTDY